MGASGESDGLSVDDDSRTFSAQPTTLKKPSSFEASVVPNTTLDASTVKSLQKLLSKVGMNFESAGAFLDSFSCGSEKKGLISHGRLYVFVLCIVFESKVFGGTRFALMRSNITEVKLRKVNRLKVHLNDGTTYKFVSFASREKCYQLLSSTNSEYDGAETGSEVGDEQQQHQHVPLSETEHRSSADSLMVSQVLLQDENSSQDPAGDASMTGSKRSSSVRPSTGFSDRKFSSVHENAGDEFESFSVVAKRESENVFIPSDEQVPVEQAISEEVAPPEPVDVEADLSWKLPDSDAEDLITGECYKAKELCARVTLPASAKVAYHVLFGDFESSCRIFKEVHLSSGDQEPINISQWTPDSELHALTREVSFIHPLAYKIGPSQTRTVEKQIRSFTSNGGVRVEFVGHSLDIPYSDNFRVESTVEITPVSDRSCEMTTFVTTRFIGKRPMVAKMIEKGTVDDTSPVFQKFCDIAKREVGQFQGALYPRGVEAVEQRPEVEEEDDEEDDDEILNDDDLPDPEEGLVWAEEGVDVFDKRFNECHDSKVEVARITLPVSTRVAYNALLIDNAGEFFKRVHAANGDLEPYEVDPWTVVSPGVEKARGVRFTHPLAYKIGPTKTRTSETQRISFSRSSASVFLDVEGHNLDIPYSDQFRAESFFELIPKDGLSATYGGAQCELVAYVATRFIGKKPMVSKMIEKGTVDDCGPAYQRLCAMALDEVNAFYLKRPGVSERRERAALRAAKAAKKRQKIQAASTRKAKAVPDYLTAARKSAATAPITVIAKAPFEVFGVDGNLIMEMTLLLILFVTLLLLMSMLIVLISLKTDIYTLSSMLSNRR